MKKSFVIVLLLFSPSLLVAQHLELGHLGLRGKVKSSLEQFNDGKYASVFRTFEEDGRLTALGIKRKTTANTWDDYFSGFIYHDDHRLQLMQTKKNKKAIKLEEYEHSGDTLIVTITTEEKVRTEKRFFDKKNRKYYWITPKITSILEFDENYLPKFYKKITPLGDMESRYETKLLKKDEQGNWIEVEMTYNVLSTRVMKKVTWKRELVYY